MLQQLMRVTMAFVCLAVLAGTAAAAELKIGVVNIPRLMEQAPQAEAASKQLEKRFGPREAELTSEREAIRKLEEQLKRDAAVMSAAKRSELEKEIRDRAREFKRASDDFKEDLNIARNEELGKLQRQIIKAIVDLSEQEQYDLVLTDNVIYASKRVDLTDQVLKRLNEMFKAPQ